MPSAYQDNPMNTKPKIRWGVMGVAAIALGRTIPALLAAPSAILLGLASRDGLKAQTQAQALGVQRHYASYEDLLTDPDIDAVYIPLPNRMHFEWAVRAMEQGKHVLCEKPLCMNSHEVRQLIEVRDRTGQYIEEAFAYRNHPQWDMLVQMREHQDIGRIRAVHATLAKQFLDPSDIRNDPAAGGGALYDLGSYTLSACNILFGTPPQQVVATLDRDPVFGIDRLTSAMLDYDGRHALFTVGTQTGTKAWGTHQHLSVLCDNGWMRLNFPFAHARPTACTLEVGDETTVGAFPSQVHEFLATNQYENQVERFSRLLLGEAVRTWPIEDSLAIVQTIEALFESARTRTWQSLPNV